MLKMFVQMYQNDTCQTEDILVKLTIERFEKADIMQKVIGLTHHNLSTEVEVLRWLQATHRGFDL